MNDDYYLDFSANSDARQPGRSHEMKQGRTHHRGQVFW